MGLSAKMRASRAEFALKYFESAHVPSVILKIEPIQHLRNFKHVLMTPLLRIKMVTHEEALGGCVCRCLLSAKAFHFYVDGKTGAWGEDVQNVHKTMTSTAVLGFVYLPGL